MALIAAPGWYVVKTDAGKLGLVLHHGSSLFRLGSGNGTVTQAAYAGDPGLSMPQLLSSAGSQVQSDLTAIGANASQLRSFMVEADTAAGKDQGHPQGGIVGFLTGLVGATPTVGGHNTTQLLFGTSGQPVASSGRTPVSTSPTGDIQNVGSSASVPSVFGVFASGSLWAGIGMTLMGAALVMFGIVKLSGGNPTQVAKRVAHV